MYDFGAEKALITTEEPWGHDITLTIDTDTAPRGALSEITGEITGFFRDFGDRAGVFLLCEKDGGFDTIGVPIDAVSGYRLAELPETWSEEDRAHLEGSRADFLEMVKDDVSWLMKDADVGLTDACFTDCGETIPTWADLKRLETWRRACPEIRGWHESPEIFLIVGVVATLDLDTASRADRLLEAFEDLRHMSNDRDAAAALARVLVDIEGLRFAARAVTYGGIHPMRGILFSLLANGGGFGSETATALAAIEDGFRDRHVRRNRSGMFH